MGTIGREDVRRLGNYFYSQILFRPNFERA
jgi:hypothetical protein